MFHCKEIGSQRELRTTGAASVTKKHPTISRKAVLSIISFAMAKKAVLIAMAMALATAGALAQMVPLSSDIMRPIPGAGHDYVKGLNETVNPANGSLSISIQLPTLPSRGITLPFSIVYNSGIVHHMTTQEYSGGTAAISTMDGSNYVQTDLSINGWSNTVPYASVSTFGFSQSADHFSISCIVSSSYTFYDARGESSPLGVAAISPPTASGVGTPNCEDATQWTPVPSAAVDNYTTTLADGGCNGSPTSPPNCAGAAPGFTVSDPDGTVYTFNANTYGNIQGPTTSTFSIPSTIEDRNGNIVTLSGGPNNNGGYTTIIVTDTSGRQAEKVAYTTINGSQVPQSYIVGGLTYTLAYKTTTAQFTPANEQVDPLNITCKTNFAVNDASLQVVKSIMLPNGQQYTFQYDPTYGLVNEIDYPGGGWVKYTWGLNGSQPQSQSFPYSDFISTPGYNINANTPVTYDVCDYWYQTPVVFTRQVGYTAGGGPALTQNFTYSTTQGSSYNLWGSKQTTVTTTDNTTGRTYQTVYTYSPIDQIVYPLPPDAQFPVQVPVEQSVVYHGFNNETLKSVAKAWLDPNFLGCETDTEPNGTSGTWYGYNVYAEPDDLKEYDYGVISAGSCSASTASTPPSTTPTRETVTNYYPFGVSPIGGTIYDRPSSVMVKGNGNEAAETDYTYSPSSFPSPASAAQHDTNYGTGTSNLLRGNAITVTRRCLTGCADNPTQLAYDETGQVVSSIDAKGNKTLYSYADSGSGAGDSNAYLTSVTGPVTNGIAHIKSYQYNYATGELTQATDENGQTTTYTYNTPPAGCATPDGLNRLSAINYPDTGQATYCYNDAGSSMTASTFATPDPTIVRTTLYDGMGRAVQTQLTSDPEGTDYVDTTYDGLGRVASVTNPYRSTSDPTDGITYDVYDALGRTTRQSQPDGSSVLWCYDGLTNASVSTCPADESSFSGDARVDSWDEDNNHWQRTSDALGRLTSVVEPDAAETDYTYDANGNLSQAVQKGLSGETPLTRNFVYDGLSRLVSAANPESGMTSYSYDPNGNVTSRTDARGIVTTYAYDALNRLLSKSYVNDPQNTPAVNYLWDISLAGEQSSPPVNNFIGHLSQAVTTVNGSPLLDWMALGYDQMERSQGYETCSATAAQLCDPLPALQGTWDFDDAGQLWDVISTFVTSWDGDFSGAWTDNSFTFDGAGNVAATTIYNSIGSFSQSVVVNTMANPTYTAFGALSAADLAPDSGGNPQMWLTRNYDTRMRLVGETDTAVASQAQIYSYSAPFDHAGELPSLNDSVVGTWSYGNDAEHRLRDMTSSAGYYSGGSLQYQYDSFGNRTAMSWAGNPQAPATGSETFNYNANNQLTSGAVYDAAGNVTDDGLNQYLYDAEGRLCAMNPYGTVGNMTGYLYDGLGNRTAKGTITTFSCDITSNGFVATNAFIYGPSGEVLAESDANLNMLYANTSLNGHLLATYTADGNLHYSFNDWLGTKRVVTSAAGAVEETCISLPFGDLLNCTGSDATGLHFTGKERDTESGLDYFGARYYGSSMGRFMSPDSAADEVLSVPIPFADLTNPQTLNLYSYVGNNPLSRTDPDGHDYTVCATGQACVHLTDQQYYDATHAQGNSGINAPAFGQSGNITCGGSVCGTASYMDQGAVTDLSGGQLMGIAGGKALGTAFGLVGEAIGRLFGSTAGEAAGAGAKVLLEAGTKQAAKDVVEGLADSAQKATLKRSIARATTKEAVSIKQLADGSVEVVKTRPGFNGSQSFTTTIGKDGASVTVQTAVDSTGAQVHYDPK